MHKVAFASPLVVTGSGTRSAVVPLAVLVCTRWYYFAGTFVVKGRTGTRSVLVPLVVFAGTLEVKCRAAVVPLPPPLSKTWSTTVLTDTHKIKGLEVVEQLTYH